MTKRIFTLIELLVVIAIIAILATILLPALSKARERAWTSQCAANMKTLVSSAHLYGNDYADYVPPGNLLNIDGSSNYRTWTRLFPMLRYIPPRKTTARDSAIAHPTLCPSLKFHDESSYAVDYSINGMLAAGIKADGEPQAYDGYYRRWNKFSEHPRYADMVLFSDSSGDSFSFSHYGWTNATLTTLRWRHNTTQEYTPPGATLPQKTFKLYGAANLGFVNGSVQLKRYYDFTYGASSHPKSLFRLLVRPQGKDY